MRHRLRAARSGARLPELRGSGGFTVIELVISMFLIGIIFAIFSVSVSSTIRTSNEVQEDAVLQGEVRATVDAIASELRQGYTGNGSPALEKMLPSQIQFLSPDRSTPFHLRRIVYQLTNKKIQRASARSNNASMPPWDFPSLSVLSTQVGSVVNTNVFTYHDANGAVTAIAADVAEVTVRLVVANPQNPGRQFTYATSIAFRVTQ